MKTVYYAAVSKYKSTRLVIDTQQYEVYGVGLTEKSAIRNSRIKGTMVDRKSQLQVIQCSEILYNEFKRYGVARAYLNEILRSALTEI